MLIPDEAFYSTLYHITDINELRKPGKVSENDEGYFEDLERRFEEPCLLQIIGRTNCLIYFPSIISNYDGSVSVISSQRPHNVEYSSTIDH